MHLGLSFSIKLDILNQNDTWSKCTSSGTTTDSRTGSNHTFPKRQLTPSFPDDISGLGSPLVFNQYKRDNWPRTHYASEAGVVRVEVKGPESGALTSGTTGLFARL